MDSEELMNLSKYNNVQLIAIIQGKNEELELNKSVINEYTDTIKRLQREIHVLKNPPVPLYKKSLLQLMEYFVEECCIYKDGYIEDNNGIERAPTEFDEFYHGFTMWCNYEDLIGRVRDIKKKSLVKTFIMKIQEESKYGLNIGKKLNECNVNGTKNRLYLNIVIKEGIY
jgi:hypothetical protein